MKKTYLTPELMVVHVEAATVICGSTKIDLAQENGQPKTTSEEEITEADARRTSQWDDDEEDYDY